MLIDSINLLEGSDVKNLVLPSGTSFPQNPNPGELFFNTTDITVYVYQTDSWVALGATETIPGGGGDTVQIYDIALSCPGEVVAASTLAYFVVPRAFTIPSTFLGSKAAVGSTVGDATFTLYKNGSAAATINFTDGYSFGQFTVVDVENLSFGNGDIFSIDSPASNTPSNLAITIVATLV